MPRALPYTFEPIRAARAEDWKIGFRLGPPQIDDPDRVARWHADYERAERNAPILLWGSACFPPSSETSLLGVTSANHGEGILGRVGPILHDHPKGADAPAMADRIVSCVNALAGVRDPQGAVIACRALLLRAFADGLPAGDLGVAKLLDRLCPAEGYAGQSDRTLENPL